MLFVITPRSYVTNSKKNKNETSFNLVHILNPTLFTAAQILERSVAGDAALLQRTQAVSPKLRAVLYLIDGERTLGALLENVGSMADLVSTQIETLGQMGLLQIKERRKEPRPDEISGAALMAAQARRTVNAEPRDAPVSNFFNPSQFGSFTDPPTKPVADDVPPLMGAKLELLALLEKVQVDSIEALAASVLEPKSLKDLAFKTKEVAAELEPLIGIAQSQAFWTAAKAVLMRWRNQNSSA